jgi:hypothetical protein
MIDGRHSSSFGVEARDSWICFAHHFEGSCQKPLDRETITHWGLTERCRRCPWWIGDFFVHGSAANLQLTIDSSNRAACCFQKAMPHFPGKLDFLEVPYEDITLPSYFWRAAKPEKPAPTLIVHSGFDGTAKEVLLWFGWQGIERGYNIIAFEGPEQGSVLRNKKKIFRHDWEQVVPP